MDKYLQNLLKHNVEKASSVIEFQSEGDGEPGEVPSVSCDSKGGEFTVHFKTSQIWEAVVVAPTKADDFSWVTLSRSRGEAGEVSLVITLKENTSYDSRRAVVRIKSGEALCEIDIFQDQVDVILVEENEFNVPAEGGNPVIVLKTNIDFEVDIPAESARWISVEPYTKALNTKYVELIVAGNDGAERSGKVYVVNKKSGISAVVTINQEAGWIDVTGVSLDKTELTITVGDPDVKLVATVTPDNATDKTVNWASDNEAVATVDNQGNVHAEAPGTANITVTTTDGNKTATCAVTVKAALPEGALPGVFSVSATKKVYFSQGNLFWDGSAFNFESAQYEIQTSWSTSHVSHFFWSKDASVATAQKYSDGGAADGDVFFTNATTETAKSDFTVNGVAGKYRMLSAEEWKYLFGTRTMANDCARYENLVNDDGITVESITFKGVVLFPDNFTEQTTWKETYTTWEALNNAGLVFLPAAGARQGSGIAYYGTNGSYWSSSENWDAFIVSFHSSGVDFDHIPYPRELGSSVRLVTEVPAE